MEELLYGDYSADFPCKCGGIIDVYIDWNNGNETPYCRNNCDDFSIQWYCDTYNGIQGVDDDKDN